MVNAAREVHKALPHLNERTADRHVFLFTCDSQFVGRDRHPLLLRSRVVHLGDDEYTRHPRELKDRVRRESAHMRNGIVVPYRVSQWLPFGFNIPAPGTRRYLLSMNVNAARHAVRKQIAKIINRTFAQQEIPVERQQEFLVTSKMMGPAEAARIALSSAFCLCPTGDSKGFTARSLCSAPRLLARRSMVTIALPFRCRPPTPSNSSLIGARSSQTFKPTRCQS